MEKIQTVLASMSSEQTFEFQNPMTEEERETLSAELFNSADGSLNEVDGYECDICHNKGLIMRAYQLENGRWTTTTRDCKCMAVRTTIRKMRRSGLKDIIKDCTFGKYQAKEEWQQTIKEAAMEYAANPQGWFFIGGQSGCGKTHLCTAICREFLLKGWGVQYMVWKDDAAKIKNAIRDGEQYGPMLDKFQKAQVLYIDDFFWTGDSKDAPPPTPGDLNLAMQILNYRYMNPDLLTIISSQRTISEILDIDEAIGGRICERAKVLNIGADRKKNYRLRGVIEL